MYIVLALVWVISTVFLCNMTSPPPLSKEKRIVKIPYLPMKKDLFAKIKSFEDSDATYILHLHEKLENIRNDYYKWNKQADEEDFKKGRANDGEVLWIIAILFPPVIFIIQEIGYLKTLEVFLFLAVVFAIWIFTSRLFRKLNRQRSKYIDPTYISHAVEGAERFNEANSFEEIVLYYKKSFEKAADMEECIDIWKAGPEDAIIKNKTATLVAVAAVFVILLIVT